MSRVAALDLDAREDQRALLIHVARLGRVCRRDRIAAVGLVGLGEHREAVDPVVVDHRDEDRVVGGVRVAVVGRVVQERVAASELGVELLHRLRHQVGAAEDVDRHGSRPSRAARRRR